MPEMSGEEQQTQELPVKRQEKDLVVWTAPSRPFQRRSKDFYTSLVAVAGLVGVVLFIIEGIMPVILVISAVFLFYVLSTIPPGDIEYKITDQGIKIGDSKTPWELLGRYWFVARGGSEILVVETSRVPGRMELVIDLAKKDEIQKALDKYLVNEQAAPTMYDKMASWATKTLPKT